MKKRGAYTIWWIIIVAVLAVLVLIFSSGTLYAKGRKVLETVDKYIEFGGKGPEELENLKLSDLTEEDVKRLEEGGNEDVILVDALREADDYYHNEDYQRAKEFYDKFLELCNKYKSKCRPVDERYTKDRIKEIEEKLLEIELSRIDAEGDPSVKAKLLEEFIKKAPEGALKSKAEGLLSKEKPRVGEVSGINNEIVKNYEDGRKLLASGLSREAIEKFKEVRFLAETDKESDSDLVRRYEFLANFGLANSYAMVEDCENTRYSVIEMDSSYRGGIVNVFDGAKDMFLSAIEKVGKCFYDRAKKSTEASRTKIDFLATFDFIYSIDSYYIGMISRDKTPEIFKIYEDVAYSLAEPVDCGSKESIGECHKYVEAIRIIVEQGLARKFNFPVNKEVVKRYPHLGCWWEYRTTNYCNYCDISLAASKGLPGISSCYDYYYLWKGGANEEVCKADPCGLGCRFVDNWGPNSCEKI